MSDLIPDLDSLRIEPVAAATQPKPRAKAARNFLRGPIPIPWLIAAAEVTWSQSSCGPGSLVLRRHAVNPPNQLPNTLAEDGIQHGSGMRPIAASRH